MIAHIHQFLCLSDNFGVLIHDPETRRTASIDAPDAGPILKALADKDWELTDILVTHHHADHTQGIPGLKAKFPDVRIVGPAKEADKIGCLDVAVGEADYVHVGALKAAVIEVPGHTAGHIAYHFEAHDILFAGDTLFALGCGRPFEAPPRVLFHSLMKLARLRGETQVYCGHEYTLSNARFALSVDGSNALLQERVAEIESLVAAGAFTLPTTIALERATNPFLRADEESLKQSIGMANADDVDVFTELRERKNRG
ncbi:hydroxyacylglutathione hydrolase [Beijerinckia sp. L45]|uniref:hydroxyacylglutathione hydrolase n=1 Tax=Beijerinckia sp. L45 TaxID=1641855 RepID=UPI00131AEFAB|nr:hydroxyacylglutathione hydrolase [Beijerinckia sp. L45]